MSKLYFNQETLVVFSSDADQPANVREVTRDEIPDLIANGATIDPSADTLLGNSTQPDGAQAAPVQAASANVSGTVGEQGNVSAAVAASDTGSISDSSSRALAGADASVAPGVAGVEVIPVVSGSTTLDVANPQKTTPGTSIDPNATPAQLDQTPAVPLTGDDKIAQEQADLANSVDTNRNVGSVLLHPVTVGSLAGTPVTPDGTPVVEAQPEAVSVKGPEVRSTSPAVGAAVVAGADGAAVAPKTVYDDLDHEGMIEQLLDDLAGFANMGKSEIAFVVDSLRGAFHRSKKGA